MASLYGIAEIATALGARRQTVAQWFRRGKLPIPDATLRMGPVWLDETIEPWIRQVRREIRKRRRPNGPRAKT